MHIKVEVGRYDTEYHYSDKIFCSRDFCPNYYI